MTNPIDPRFEALAQAGVADDVVRMLSSLIRDAPDHELSRVNPYEIAARAGMPVDRVLDGFLHAAKLGVFDLSWTLLCPGCGGVLSGGVTLKSVKRAQYPCGLCAKDYEVTADELIEVSFTVNSRVRGIAAHNPTSLPLWQYFRQLYFSHATIMPEGDAWDALYDEVILASQDLAPHARTEFVRELPSEFLIVFDPIVHGATFLDVMGERTDTMQEVSVVFSDTGASPAKLQLRPGPATIRVDNLTDKSLRVAVMRANDRLHELLRRKPYVTAKRLFTTQTFRDLFRAESMDVDQRIKIASLTVLFTDLKGSTEMYERIGDLAAYDLVRSHFQVLSNAVTSNGGAVVKTIGDAVMATFPTAAQGVNAAFEMRGGIDALNARRGAEDVLVKIGMHEGPCLAVVSNDRLDYFGQTVNIAARVQGLADSRAILATSPIVQDGPVREILAARSVRATTRRASLKGIREEMTLFELP